MFWGAASASIEQKKIQIDACDMLQDDYIVCARLLFRGSLSLSNAEYLFGQRVHNLNPDWERVAKQRWKSQSFARIWCQIWYDVLNHEYDQ